MAEDPSTLPNGFQSRLASVQARVNTAALALHERNVRPTVARIRAALGGGSPNELAPALRHWKDEVLPTLAPQPDDSGSRVPPQIADIVQELWTRATAAAVVEVKGGDPARQAAARSEESRILRDQVTSLRNQLERDAIVYGELRAQSARHEAIAREALGRIRELEDRARKALQQLGEARQRVAELTATLEQLKARPRGRPAQRQAPARRASKPTSTRQQARPRKPLKARPRRHHRAGTRQRR
jgi:hypothetical protein